MEIKKLFTIILFSCALLPARAFTITDGRECRSLGGQWNYIVDPMDTGIYKYHMTLQKPHRRYFADRHFYGDKTKLVEYDFDKYPYAGFKADIYREWLVNGEYMSHQWLLCNDDGVPMVGLNIFEFLPHGLYQEYAYVAWDFMKHYSRNQETKEIVYTAIVD